MPLSIHHIRANSALMTPSYSLFSFLSIEVSTADWELMQTMFFQLWHFAFVWEIFAFIFVWNETKKKHRSLVRWMKKSRKEKKKQSKKATANYILTLYSRNQKRNVLQRKEHFFDSLYARAALIHTHIQIHSPIWKQNEYNKIKLEKRHNI